MKESYVLQAFLEGTWAILPNKLAMLHEIVIRHVSGEKLDPEEIQARIHGAARPQGQRISSLDVPGETVTRTVAVLPLFGTIFPRGNLMTNMSGATSAEQFGAQFQELVDDPEIDAIVLDVNSPGGYASGVEELSDRIYAARGTKPITAVSNHQMASAAFWVASAADEVVVTPSGEVGSVGVFAVHQDVSQALEQEGVKVTLISAGKYKIEGNSYQPLGEEARAAIQSSVDETYEKFTSALARNRNVSPQTVKNDFGEGRMVSASRAIQNGMADRVGSLQEIVSQYLSLDVPSSGQQAVENVNDPHALLDLSSEPEQPEVDTELKAQAQRLRERVTPYIRQKGENHD